VYATCTELVRVTWLHPFHAPHVARSNGSSLFSHERSLLLLAVRSACKAETKSGVNTAVPIGREERKNVALALLNEKPAVKQNQKLKKRIAGCHLFILILCVLNSFCLVLSLSLWVRAAFYVWCDANM
jgi:hypothetical protein